MPDVCFHVVPDDPTVPYPMDLARVAHALKQFGAVQQNGTEDRTYLEFTAGEESYMSSFDSSQRYLSLRRMWPTELSYSANRQLLMTAADNWNRGHYYPTVYTMASKENGATVIADATIECRYGLSEAQLNDFLLLALSTCADAIEYMVWATQRLLSLK